jgi:hypothetical protein
VLHDLLDPAPDHLRQAHLVLGGDAFRLPVETVWNLNLRLDHDGNLPSWVISVNNPPIPSLASDRNHPSNEPASRSALPGKDDTKRELTFF